MKRLLYFNISFFLFVLFALALISPDLFGRAGGGGGFGGGGGHGGGGGFGGGGGHGGGGGDGLGQLIYLLIRLGIAYPHFGIPALILIVVAIIYSKRTGDNAYSGYVIRKGANAWDMNRDAVSTAALRASDPAFDDEAFRSRVRSACIKIQDAWCAQNIESVRAFISDGIHERFSLQLQEQREQGYRDQMEDLRILGCTLAQVETQGGYDSVTVCLKCLARDYRVDLEKGGYLEGSREDEEFAEFWTLLRRRGAQTKTDKPGLFEGVCPNCGAAIEMNQSANCKFCKALLRSGEHDWVLVEITQASEWETRDRTVLPGVTEIQKTDTDFNVACLEDHASVMFWRRAMAARRGDATPLRKIASPEFCANFENEIAASARNETGGRIFYGECAVGAVETRGILPEGAIQRAIVEVRWDGVQYTVDKDGNVSRGERGVVRRSYLVLSRKAGVLSRARNGVGSAHCPNCGAPEALSMDSVCTYCGVMQNDGSLGWNLSAMHAWASPDSQALLNELRSQTRASPLDEVIPGLPLPTTADAQPIPANAVVLMAWMVRAARADGEITEDERKLLLKAAAKYKIDETRVHRMLNAPDANAIETPGPADPMETKAWIEALAALALADGRITNSEWQLLYLLAERHGLSRYDVGHAVQLTRARLYQQARDELRKSKELRPR